MPYIILLVKKFCVKTFISHETNILNDDFFANYRIVCVYTVFWITTYGCLDILITHDFVPLWHSPGTICKEREPAEMCHVGATLPPFWWMLAQGWTMTFSAPTLDSSHLNKKGWLWIGNYVYIFYHCRECLGLVRMFSGWIGGDDKAPVSSFAVCHCWSYTVHVHVSSTV